MNLTIGFNSQDDDLSLAYGRQPRARSTTVHGRRDRSAIVDRIHARNRVYCKKTISSPAAFLIAVLAPDEILVDSSSVGRASEQVKLAQTDLDYTDSQNQKHHFDFKIAAFKASFINIAVSAKLNFAIV